MDIIHANAPPFFGNMTGGQSYYTVAEDWSRTRYCGITIEWEYNNKRVFLSMPGYIPDALHKYQHPTPKRAQQGLDQCKKPHYGAPIQLTTLPDTLPPL
eukprot:15326185-Ditylum_brightwellii.AAC.2